MREKRENMESITKTSRYRTTTRGAWTIWSGSFWKKSWSSWLYRSLYKMETWLLCRWWHRRDPSSVGHSPWIRTHASRWWLVNNV